MIPGKLVHKYPYAFDGTGAGFGLAGVQLIPDPTNTPPKFALSQAAQEAYSNGVKAWNAHSGANGSGVLFSPGISSLGGNIVITTMWPKANVVYPASDGTFHTLPVDVSGEPATAVAATIFMPDWNNGVRLDTAAIAVTLINTNGTISSGGSSYPMWNPNASNFGTALTDLAVHEVGHGFGITDRTSCGDVMSGWSLDPSNPANTTNNGNNCSPGVISSCDDSEIHNNPNQQYNPPPPPCEPLEGCASQDPFSCSCLKWLTGGGPCDGCWSPIVIDLDGSGYAMTNVANGVFFDLDSDGDRRDRIAWTSAGSTNAFLGLDRNQNRRIDNGRELFGNFTLLDNGQRAPNGWVALAEFDKPQHGGNDDGIIDKRDAVYSALRLWIDANHDGISQPGELHTLASLGVESFSLDFKPSNRRDQYGNRFRFKAIVEGHNPVTGESYRREAYDVFLVTAENSPRSSSKRALVPVRQLAFINDRNFDKVINTREFGFFRQQDHVGLGCQPLAILQGKH